MNKERIELTYLSQEDFLKGGCFDIRLTINSVEKGLLAFHKGDVLFPDKIVQIFNKETQERINCLPATLLPEKVCGVKWVSVFPPNPRKYGVQNLSALFVLSEIEKGFPIAVMDGTLASNMRVASVGATAAKYLARKDSESIGFIGAGEQSKMHLVGMKTVFPGLKECRVAAKYEEEEDRFIQEMSTIFHDMTFIAGRTDLKTAMDGADILVTGTSAQAPLLKAEWMKPGAFYSHIGGWEDEYAVAEQCQKIVCDSWETVKHRTQTLSRMYKDGKLKDSDIYADLVDLVSGQKPGRESDDERIYFNAVGLSYLDVTIAHDMYLRAIEAGVGTKLPLQERSIFSHEDLGSFIRL